MAPPPAACPLTPDAAPPSLSASFPYLWEPRRAPSSFHSPDANENISVHLSQIQRTEAVPPDGEFPPAPSPKLECVQDENQKL